MRATTVDTMGIIMMDIVATDILMTEIVAIKTMGNMKVETMTTDIGNNMV